MAVAMSEAPPLDQLAALDPSALAEHLNSRRSGWNDAVDLVVVSAAGDRVEATLEITERHHQPYGIVHGGVYASVIESVCSIGAALDVLPSGYSAVGLENHTSFLRAVRGGRLSIVAEPLSRGRRSQLWQAEVRDEAGKLAATGRVRMLCLEPGAQLSGEPVSLRK